MNPNKIPNTYDSIFRDLYKRKIFKNTFAIIKELFATNVLSYPVFIKPADNNKKFDGTILYKESQFEYLDMVNNTDLVYACEFIQIDGEYRLFLYKELGIAKYKIINYSGSVNHQFNSEFINKILNCMNGSKYEFLVVDVGFFDIDNLASLENSKTTAEFIIEVNPPFWVDSYEIDSEFYAEFSTNAWNWLQA
jgi:hypothetical protein